MIFKNRTEAGQLLAEKLKAMNLSQPVIYGIPRGGLVCAKEIANVLNAPLSAIIARKIGHPHNPEYAIGAINESGDIVLSPDAKLVNKNWLKNKIKEKKLEAKNRREYILMGDKPLSLKDETAVVVDDGLATGLTMEVALLEIKKLEPKRIIVAVAVAGSEIAKKIINKNYELVALETPKYFLGAIGNYYESFDQVSDDEARTIYKTSKIK